MPNWARGLVDVTGTKEAVISFINRFYFADRPCDLSEGKMFAGAAALGSYEDAIHQIALLFSSTEGPPERLLQLDAEFAWSAYTALVAINPDELLGHCITLQDACRQDGVDISIVTTDPAMCFREQISCTRTGAIRKVEQDLSDTVICKRCGISFKSHPLSDLDGLTCTECGGTELQILHTK